MQYLDDLRALQADLAEQQRAVERVNREEVLFQYKPTPFSTLQHLHEQIEPSVLSELVQECGVNDDNVCRHATLWELVANWQLWHQEWMCALEYCFA
jgi:hypothetical protein